jgi:hypothetical protein
MRSHCTNRMIVRRFRIPILSAAALLVACEREMEPPTASPNANLAQDALPAEVSEQLKAQLERFSGMPMFILAQHLGVTEIQGKSIKPPSDGPKGTHSPKKLMDVPIGTDLTAHENEPTVATSPKNKKLLVVGNHREPPPGSPFTVATRCEARHSSDGGVTWSAPVLMPQLTPASQCSDPVLAYSPDGGRVYYVYMDIKLIGADDIDIIVSQSTDNGQTWSLPVIALNGIPGVVNYDKPWIGTPDDAANFVYVTATRFDATGCQIVFTRSTNGGTSYATPTTLDSGGCSFGFFGVQTVQGSRPAGGKQGNVLVAWYNSGPDGWLTGSFTIRTAHSADFGATFATAVDAVTDASETPFWKGPFSCYHRWWASMWPDVEIDPSGGGHIAYTHDPVAGSSNAEDGNIRYASSSGPPYTNWSSPTTVNDDGTVSAQGYVALEIKAEGTGQSAKPHAAWMDDRLPLELVATPECSGDIENLEYNIFYSTYQGGGWRANVRVSDQSSLSDRNFVGDYIDLTTDNGSLYTVWTDRRDKRSIFDLEDDAWGSRTHRVH